MRIFIHLFNLPVVNLHTIDHIRKKRNHIVVTHGHIGNNFFESDLLGSMILVFLDPITELQTKLCYFPLFVGGKLARYVTLATLGLLWQIIWHHRRLKTSSANHYSIHWRYWRVLYCTCRCKSVIRVRQLRNLHSGIAHKMVARMFVIPSVRADRPLKSCTT